MNSKVKYNYHEKYKPPRHQHSFQNSTNKYESLNHNEMHKPLRSQYSFSNSSNSFDGKHKYQIIRSSSTRKHPYKKQCSLPNNFRSNFSNKNVAKKASKIMKSSVEDEEDENRKKKLSDLANKLLSKIKTWSADCDLQNDSVKLTSINEHMKSSDKNIKDKMCENSDLGANNISDNKLLSSCNEEKFKRISHSLSQKKESNVKKPDSKTFNTDTGKLKKKFKRCNVNKFEVENKSNIQHKLINQIMHMPKKNLENMLNDPKINPTMAAKISVLVKENKLLLAQKLRALAESKVMLNSSSSQGDLLFDIDKLIEPVVETDLSLLPAQFIKEMENIFQIQFHDSNKKTKEKFVMSESESEVIFQNLNFQSNDTLDGLTVSDEEATTNTLSKYVKIENFGENKNISFNDCSKSTTSIKKPNFITLCENIKIETCSDNEHMDENYDENVGNINTPEHTMFDKKVNIDTSCESIKMETSSDNDNLHENIDPYVIDTPKSISSDEKFKLCTDIMVENNQENIDHRCTTKNLESFNTNINIYPFYKNDNIEPENNESINVKDDEISKGHSNISLNVAFDKYPESCNKIGEKILESFNAKSVDSSTLNECLNNFQFSGRQNKNQNMKIEPIIALFSKDSCTSKGCQTKIDSQTTATQTELHSKKLDDLLEIHLLQFFPRTNRASLFEEINFIQELINKLNERRLKLFLELVKAKDHQFIPDELTSVSLMETISNGNIHLINFLKQFFSSTQTLT